MTLISREAAIEAIESHLRVGDEVYPLTRTDKILNHAFEIAASCVYNLPTAERVGRWIEFDSAEDKYDVIKCPFCKHTFTVDSYHWTDIGFIKDDFKYCPNCGARMKGEEV